jgi:hypothetical protein
VLPDLVKVRSFSMTDKAALTWRLISPEKSFAKIVMGYSWERRDLTGMKRMKKRKKMVSGSRTLVRPAGTIRNL